MKFGDLLRAPAPAALAGGRRAAPLPGSARPGRARRPARLRLRVGGRAPLPRGVLALRRRPRSSSPRARSARSGSGSATASCSCRRATATRRASPSRIATLDLVSNGRVDFGTGESASRMELEGYGIDPAREARDVARGHRAGLQHARDGPVPGLRGQVLLDAVPQRRAEAGAEAAPAALARVLEPRHDPSRRAARRRRAHLRVRRPGRGAPLGHATTTRRSSASACRSATP